MSVVRRFRGLGVAGLGLVWVGCHAEKFCKLLPKLANLTLVFQW